MRVCPERIRPKRFVSFSQRNCIYSRKGLSHMPEANHVICPEQTVSFARRNEIMKKCVLVQKSFSFALKSCSLGHYNCFCALLKQCISKDDDLTVFCYWESDTNSQGQIIHSLRANDTLFIPSGKLHSWLRAMNTIPPGK